MPSLTDANKTDRARFAVSHIHSETLVVDSVHDVVHIDEKWFIEDSTSAYTTSYQASNPLSAVRLP